MNKKIFKKIYYSLVKNIPLYEINNDRNNKEKQQKIETKILELLNYKSFKITNPGFLQPTDVPVYKLPDFMTIVWPKGIDNSYFKSYQILNYYQNIGMIKFKLTLKNDISKEYSIRGFDTWDDILRQSEEQIINTFTSSEITNYLSSKDFKVKLGTIYDTKIKELINPLWNNYFIKPIALKMKVKSINYNNESFNLEIQWDLDKKFDYQIQINSLYVKYLNEQKAILEKFVNRNSQLQNNIANMDYSLRLDKNYLQTFWKKDLNESNEDIFHNLTINLLNENDLNASVVVAFINKDLDITLTKQFKIDWLEQRNKINKKISALINNFDFLNDIYTLYHAQTLDEENIKNLLIEWELDPSQFTLEWKKHTNSYFLIVELRNKKYDSGTSTFITITNELLDRNISSIYELYELTMNDLSFQKIIITDSTKLFEHNNDLFSYLISKYDSPWINQLRENPFEIKLANQEENVDCIKLITNISGSMISKLIYSKKLNENLDMSRIMLAILSDNSIVNKIKKLSYIALNEPESLSQILHENNFVYNQEIYNFWTTIQSPYNAIKLIIKNIKTNDEYTKFLDVTSNTYNTISALKDNVSFLNKLSELVQKYLLTPNDFNQDEVINLIQNYTNGVVFSGISFMISETTDNKLKLSVNFASIYPSIDFIVDKTNNDLSVSELFNELTLRVEQFISADNNLVVDAKKDHYSIQELIDIINDSRFNSLKEHDGTFNITSWYNSNDPRVFFELEIKDLNLSVSTYCEYTPVLNEILQTLFNEIYQNKKSELNEIIENEPQPNIQLLQKIFDGIKVPKWFKLKKVSINKVNDKFKFYYNNTLILEI